MKPYRSLALSLLVLGTIAAALSFSSCNDSPTSPGQSDIERRVNDLINQHRASVGLAPLTLVSSISDIARDHTAKMASGARPLGHDGFNDRSNQIAQLIPVSATGENVAFNLGVADPASQAVNDWLNSPPHKANIEGDFDITGIGVVNNDKGEFYFTQLFAKKQ